MLKQRARSSVRKQEAHMLLIRVTRVVLNICFIFFFPCVSSAFPLKFPVLVITVFLEI